MQKTPVRDDDESGAVVDSMMMHGTERIVATVVNAL